MKTIRLSRTRTYICAVIWYQNMPSWLQKLFPQLIWQQHSEDKIVYLTFDDGPHPEITKWVLDLLSEKNIKATFFCVGDNVRKHPETFALLRANGHNIGNHTMHHIKGWSNDNQTYLNDIEMCHQYTQTNLFRPPYGRIKMSQIKLLAKKYKIIMWTLLSCDFDKNLDIASALDGLKRKTKNGSIVVFHDSVKAEKNLKIILPDYIDYLINKGYQFKAL